MDIPLKEFIEIWDKLKNGNKEKFLKYLLNRYGKDKHGRRNILTYMAVLNTEEE